MLVLVLVLLGLLSLLLAVLVHPAEEAGLPHGTVGSWLCWSIPTKAQQCGAHTLARGCDLSSSHGCQCAVCWAARSPATPDGPP